VRSAGFFAEFPFATSCAGKSTGARTEKEAAAFQGFRGRVAAVPACATRQEKEQDGFRDSGVPFLQLPDASDAPRSGSFLDHAQNFLRLVEIYRGFNSSATILH
jgi:hypothetical protein